MMQGSSGHFNYGQQQFQQWSEMLNEIRLIALNRSTTISIID